MKPVVGYEEYFSVTEDGRIYSHRTNRWLKLNTHKDRGITFASRINGRSGKAICLKVHRCVAEAYIPNPENKPEVNHKDGVRGNNCVTNLDWVTKSENIRHAFATGLAKASKGIHHSNAKLSLDAVTLIRENKNNLNIRELAKLHNVHWSTISRCKTSKRYK
jgi:hypothetical protein